jgi:hypothetical protein
LGNLFSFVQGELGTVTLAADAAAEALDWGHPLKLTFFTIERL